ncbi:MAG: SH3 domain-containing protein, partial [Acetatifactor sp.]|nr:SH3 domain-containing protein [Acetatifactor sp.]
MRETANTRIQLKAMVMTMVTMMMVVLVFGLTTIISHAEDARVTARSVVIRAGADVGTEMVGGASQGDILPITGESFGADGYTWYQVTFAVDGVTRTGYVRSDLVEKVSGGSATITTTPTTTTPASTPSTDVVAVQPVSAKVTKDGVNVRSNASTSGSVVDMLQKDVVLTVVGTALDSENKTWYQVNFTNASGQVAGFVREDFVTLEGGLIPA